MNTLRLCFLELCRLLACRLTWLVIALTLLSPLSGLWFFRPASAGTMLSMYLANPAIVGGAAGGILFGLFTVYELDRSVRSRVNLLTDAVIPAPRMALIHLWALSAAALLALCLTMAVWLPVSRALIGSVFDIEDFALAYLLFMRARRLKPGSLCGLRRAEPHRMGGPLAALLAQSVRLGAVRRFLQRAHVPLRGLYAV